MSTFSLRLLERKIEENGNEGKLFESADEAVTPVKRLGLGLRLGWTTLMAALSLVSLHSIAIRRSHQDTNLALFSATSLWCFLSCFVQM